MESSVPNSVTEDCMEPLATLAQGTASVLTWVVGLSLQHPDSQEHRPVTSMFTYWEMPTIVQKVQNRLFWYQLKMRPA